MKNALKRSLSILLAITIIFSSAYVGLGEIDFSGLFAVKASAESVGDIVEFNNHYYQVFDDSLTWTNAQARCEELGGHLVTITSQEEQDFLIDLAVVSSKKNLWIGAKADSNGVYSWVTGETFSFTNWASGEPNNVFDSQYTAMMYTQNASYDTGLWNDENENGRSWSGYYLSDFGFVCEWEESYNVPEIIASDSYTINVKALSNEENEDGTKKEIPAVGADVTVYSGTSEVITKKSDESGNVTFTKKELISNGVIESGLLGCTVSAHLQLGNDFELCSETISPNGVWEGEPLKTDLALTVDEPRWKPSLKVLINEGDVFFCKEMLKDYSEKFAQSTNGHVIVNDFNLIVVPDDFSIRSEKYLREYAINRCINISMVRHYDTGAWASVYAESDIQGGLDNVIGGYEFYGIIWCPINNSHCAETLCHESGHYLLGFRDEYASGVGVYGKGYNLWTGGTTYSYDYSDTLGTGAANQKIEPREKIAAYWDKHCTDKVANGKIERPSNAPSNFGLMEIQWFNNEALEMSRESTYGYLASKIIDYDSLDIDKVKPYTVQFYSSNASCEEKMAYELDSIASMYDFSTSYSYASQLQRAEYWYAGGDNVTFTESSHITMSTLSLSDYESLQLNSISETEEIVNGCQFSFDGSNLNITSQGNIDVLIKDLDDIVVFSATLNEENSYTSSFETTVGSSYNITTTETINGESVTTEYYLNALSVDSNFDFNNESPTVVLYSENETQAVILHNNETVTNGDYSSVIGEYNIISNSPTETTGELQTSLSFDLDIDFSSLTWFYMADSEWVALETTYSIDDHCNPNYSCSYAGNGKYCLMAKTASEETINTPTGLTVSGEGQTTDGEVFVQFTDDNADILNYNIYYSTEPITAENCEDAVRIAIGAGSNEAYITVEDVGATYYFAIQAVGKSGSKSEISESVSYTCSYIDSDSDGIPDYWLDIYYQLKDLDDIAGTDSDEDGLTNLQEYENGTNPVNSDTDGDNVYDFVELACGLNPLEPMTDGITDDYTVVYGTPDLKITDITFGDDYIYFNVSNETDGKAMRAIINIINDDVSVASWTVNIDSQSTVEFSVERSLLNISSGFTIEIDSAQSTRDIDYSNNSFEYIPATSIALDDITIVKGSSQVADIIYEPTNINDVFKWSRISGSLSISVDAKTGVVSASGIGQAKIQVETLSGLTADCTVTSISFDGSGYTEFDCELINDNTEVAILGYIGEDNDITIPEYIGDYPVTQLNSTCIPSGVTNVTIPSTVETIDVTAFNNCETLQSINVDENNSLYASVDGVLYNDDKTSLLRVPRAYLETIFIVPDTVLTIGEYACQHYSNLIDITIPDSVTNIGAYAFKRCENLTSVTIGNNVESINEDTFAYCSSLNSIIIPDSVTSINKGAFYYCSGLVSITIPDSVTTIGSLAFKSCENLLSVTIGNGVTTIEEYAFKSCLNLSSLILGNKVESIGQDAFAYCECLKSVEFPDSLTSIGRGVFYNCTGLGSVTIPNSVTEIGDYAFNYCSNLSEVVLPNSAVTIGKYAFAETGIIELTLPENVVSIGNFAFSDCDSLQKINYNAINCTIDVANIFTAMTSHPFKNSSNITEITIGDSVETIPSQMFYGRGSITSVYITDLAHWCSINFKGVNANPINFAEEVYLDGELITELVIPSTVETINNYAFYNFTGLTSVTIPDSITNIDTKAFYNCSDLKYVFYTGSENDWGNITIGTDNTPLTGLAVHYNATDHTYEDKIDVEVTCTEDGLKHPECIVCGLSLESEVIPAHGHSYSTEWTIDVAPTCTEEGSKSHHCTVCGDKADITVIVANGHSYEVTNIESSHPHTTKYKCTDCKSIKIETVGYSDCSDCTDEAEAPIIATADSQIDYDNSIILTSIQNADDIFDVLGVSENVSVIVNVSHAYGNLELYGTGTIITVFDGDEYIGDFTLIVEGDLNGDSVCDVLDAAQAQRYSAGLQEPSENEILAANGCISDEIDVNSYQNVVNTALAS